MIDVDSAATLLLGHRNAGMRLPALPEGMRPDTRLEGYAIQAAWGPAEGDLFGWKIAATNIAGQRHINVSGPLAGRIFTSRLLNDGDTVSLTGNAMRVAEMEVAFVFGEDLPARNDAYTVDEVMTAVASLHPAIEVPDSRYTDFTVVGEAQAIADNACACWFLPGPAATDDWRAWDLAAFAVSGGVAGGETFDGRGVNVLGDPRTALTWCVNELSALGIALRAGQMVTTGTLSTPIPVTPGDHVTADFGALGTLSLRFSE